MRSSAKRVRMEEVLLQIPEWPGSESDSEEVEPTEVDLKHREIAVVEKQIAKLECEIQELRKKKRRLNEDLDNISGARYIPTSLSYDPHSDIALL